MKMIQQLDCESMQQKTNLCKALCTFPHLDFMSNRIANLKEEYTVVMSFHFIPTSFIITVH